MLSSIDRHPLESVLHSWRYSIFLRNVFALMFRC